MHADAQSGSIWLCSKFCMIWKRIVNACIMSNSVGERNQPYRVDVMLWQIKIYICKNDAEKVKCVRPAKKKQKTILKMPEKAALFLLLFFRCWIQISRKLYVWILEPIYRSNVAYPILSCYCWIFFLDATVFFCATFFFSSHIFILMLSCYYCCCCRGCRLGC